MTETLRSSLVRIAAEIARSIYREGDSKDDYLGDLAIEVRDLANEVGQLDSVLCKRTARLQVLRESMSVLQWHHFCFDHPDAEEWFDEDGVPK